MLDWLFKKQPNAGITLGQIGIDIHSHLLPGIDDGVQTIEEAVEMVSKLQLLGYTHLITTPHVIWDCYRNTPDIILEKLSLLRAAVEEAGLEIRIDAAAEYFLDEHFNEMLRNGEKILTLPGNRILVELPYSTPLMNTSETLFSIIEMGFQPILAHPERYTYFYSDPSIYRKLSDQGCELQVNILSLTGYYGENITKMANWLLENRLITYLGTDAHKMQHLELIQKVSKRDWLINYPFKNQNLTTLK